MLLRMSSVRIEPLGNIICDLGEGPHWDIETQSLYFVDIHGRNGTPVHRYDYNENRTYSAKLANCDGEQSASFIIPVKGKPNHFAIGLHRDVGVIEWDGKSAEAKVIRIAISVDKEDHFKNNVINDGKADAAGRIYFGTRHSTECFTKATGNAYRFANGELSKKLFGDVFISNGLTWNVAKRKFYYIDSMKYNIMEYDYDPETGDIANGRVLIEFPGEVGHPQRQLPDGMTIDSDGFLYVALFWGSKVVKIDPTTGTIVQEIPIPTGQVTSVAFGGPNLDILFVTTAAAAMSGPQPPPPPAGSTFKITGIAKGLPMHKARV